MRAITINVVHSKICQFVCWAQKGIPFGGKLEWAKGIKHLMKSTMAPPGKYKWSICAAAAMRAGSSLPCPVVNIHVSSLSRDYWANLNSSRPETVQFYRHADLSLTLPKFWLQSQYISMLKLWFKPFRDLSRIKKHDAWYTSALALRDRKAKTYTGHVLHRF